MATRNDGIFIHKDSDFELRLINGEAIGFIPKAHGMRNELRATS